MVADSNKISAYFSHLVSIIEANRDIHCVAVSHMVPNTLLFLPALNELMTLAGVLAKPKSVPRHEYKIISKQYSTQPLSREWAADPDGVVKKLQKLGLSGKKVILIDIGGYFSSSINSISQKFNGAILGVMEGTENGVKRYEKQGPHITPIVTVARSPLKLPEDHLVASSIVFSIEATLREQAEILQTRSAAVIGYGRVGSSVAEILRGRGINTVVFDKDPVALALAAAKGFQANTRLTEALSHASLVVCATGNTALDLPGFGLLRSGCVVASVTSSDDELDLPSLSEGYTRKTISEGLVKYEENRGGGRHFYLVADGNAANFLHGAVIGPAIQLIEGEKLMAVSALMKCEIPSGNTEIAELGGAPRRIVAEVWNEHFL